MPKPESSTEIVPRETSEDESTPVSEAAEIAAEAEAAAAEAAAALAEVEAQEVITEAVAQAEAVALEAATVTQEIITENLQPWQTKTEQTLAQLAQNQASLQAMVQEMAAAISAIPALISSAAGGAIQTPAPVSDASQSGQPTEGAPESLRPEDPAAVAENLPPAPAPKEKPRRSWI